MVLPISLAFRKFTRGWLEYQGTPPLPIPVLANPASIELNPGIEQGEIETTSETGERTIALVYDEALKGTIKMAFPGSCPELDSLILGRKFATASSVTSFVVLEIPLRTGVTSYPARTSGQYGFDIVAQTAASTTALAFYVDPTTKLRKTISIVDATPTGDQIIIGNAGAITVSTALAAAEHTITIKVPTTISSATIMTGTATPLVSAYLVGIGFDNKIRLVTAKNCQYIPGAALTGDPGREVNLRILRDPGDGTGLGFSIQDLDRLAVA